MYVRTVQRTVRGSNKKKVFSSCSRLIIPYNIRYPIEVLALHLTNNDFGINSLASFFSKLLTNYLEIYHKPSLESLTKRWRVGSISYCNHIGNLIKGLSALRIHRKKVVLFILRFALPSLPAAIFKLIPQSLFFRFVYIQQKFLKAVRLCFLLIS